MLGAIAALLLVGVGVLAGVQLSSAAAPAVAAAPVTPVPVAAASTAVADQQVCVDLDARGGSLYSVFVLPMTAGESGRKSIDVDMQQMSRATAAVARLDPVAIAGARPEIADEARRVVAAAESFELYSHVDGTALLTSFVGLSVQCQVVGHQPSWFDAQELLDN